MDTRSRSTLGRGLDEEGELDGGTLVWESAPLTEPVSSDKDQTRNLRLKLGISFFLFGLINNVLYVIILSAALDLVPPSTPKGIIAFCNIFPALIAKVGWPYVLKGQIRYARRLVGCCLLSVLGMVVVALFDSLFMRLLGISLASFSSGLGELTFLQLSTTYPSGVAGHGIGYFASGTGAAGLVGAFIWWEVRGLGVRTGVGLSAVMPFIIPITYFFLLPRRGVFTGTAEVASSPALYVPLPDSDVTTEEEEEDRAAVPGEAIIVALSLDDKWRLVKPLLVNYMLPLFCVYTFEYTINQGIAPTLLYPVPDPSSYPLLSKIIHSIRDYYPLWQVSEFNNHEVTSAGNKAFVVSVPDNRVPLPLVDFTRHLCSPEKALATTVDHPILHTLYSRSGIRERHLRGLGRQKRVLRVRADQSRGNMRWNGIVSAIASYMHILSDQALIAFDSVNVYHQINQERSDPGADPERAKQEREFKIGSVGFADSLGILCASIVAVPTEVELCKAQVRRGKTLCQGL